jgi:polysaccharide export outer membrane protein
MKIKLNLIKSRFLLIFFISILSSCISNKRLIYLQDMGMSTVPSSTISDRIPYDYEEYVLQKFDIVDINIKTSIKELNELFDINNAQGAANMMAGGQGGGDVFFMTGYTIDDQGFVDLPLIGKIKLHGYTIDESKALIEKELVNYVKEGNYFVRVRLGGIRFSTLGEFNNPGKQTILQSRATIFEAIAAANDLSVLAKRNEIILIRQYPDGSQMHKINLNDRNLLSSDFYFIKPNDILYAEPLKVREIGNTTNFIQTFSLITSTVTAIALILTLVNN